MTVCASSEAVLALLGLGARAGAAARPPADDHRDPARSSPHEPLPATAEGAPSAATTTRSSGPRRCGSEDYRLVRRRRHRHRHARRLRLGADPARAGRVRLLDAGPRSSSGPPPTGRSICLATGTGAHPAWLARAHPEVTRIDFEGRRHRFGQRHNSCPSSPVFRRLVRRAGPPASRQRYARQPGDRRLARRQRVRRRVLLRAVRGGLPRLAARAVRDPGRAQRRPGTPRSGRTPSPTGTRSSRRPRSPSTGAGRTTPRSRASRWTTCGSCPTRCSPTSCDEKAAIRESSRRHAGHHQLHGHVPADRLPPLGRRTWTSPRGTTTRRTTRHRRGWR